MKQKIPLFIFALSLCFAPLITRAQIDILTKEERLWLQNRNNTIVVYPEKNNPPFVYLPSPTAEPIGLSIEYLERIAEKVHARLSFLPAKSRAQVLAEVAEGKGDVVVRTDETVGSEASALRYTQSYLSVPVVLAVRRDSRDSELTLADLAGKRIAVTSASGAAEFIRKNYPRVVVHQVTDDEIGLQQLVLGEVDAQAIDLASLSYFLSRQALSAVKVVGHTGFYYQLAFAVPEGKAILQSILDKGLTQVSDTERQLISEKWMQASARTLERTPRSWFGGDQTFVIVAAILGGALLISLVLLGIAKWHYRTSRFYKRFQRQDEAKEKLRELEAASAVIESELKEIKALEHEVASVITDTKTDHL
ncbi:MAG TPA: transporter substrate-binding domain-containing protein [Candidatus Paceibacterota bacterium]|nr:transporter substrate-binding domain-containing protein [Candidatus Paceibacterota bacterium]